MERRDSGLLDAVHLGVHFLRGKAMHELRSVGGPNWILLGCLRFADVYLRKPIRDCRCAVKMFLVVAMGLTTGTSNSYIFQPLFSGFMMSISLRAKGRVSQTTERTVRAWLQSWQF